jgi:hypothetical protein
MQSNDDPSSEADSLAAFLSDLMIKDSLLVPTTAKNGHQKPQHELRPSSPPHPLPDLPSGTLRRRNTIIPNDDRDGNNDNDSPLMLHEQRQNQNRRSHHGITLKLSSPSCVRAVLHKESATGSGGGGGGGIPPLPFNTRPNEQSSSTSSSRLTSPLISAWAVSRAVEPPL